MPPPLGGVAFGHDFEHDPVESGIGDHDGLTEQMKHHRNERIREMMMPDASHEDSSVKEVASEPKAIDLAGRRLVRVTDARAPHKLLDIYALDATPRVGDGILVRMDETDRRVAYRVSYVNHDPFNTRAQVTVGVMPFDAEAAPSSTITGIGDAKERMDQIVKGQVQIFEKAQAYTNVIIAAGYAGSLALWNFAKPNMTPRGVAWTVLLIGISLVAFVTWEITLMIYRATAMAAFGKAVRKQPTDFFRLLDEYNAEQQQRAAKNYILWKVTLAPTILMGYAGALLIIYNAAANIVGLPQWP